MFDAISQIVQRFFDVGWVSTTKITPGRLHIEYTDLGKEQMGTLMRLFIEELHIQWTNEQFEAMIALLLMFRRTHEASPEDREPR